MKKILLIIIGCLLLTSYNLEAQEVTDFRKYADNELNSNWDVNKHNLTINYNTLGQSFAQGMWYGGLGYATGMWLSGNNTKWGIVGSILAVNIPILLDKDYNNNEVWIGKNLGAASVSLSFTFSIEMYRNGKSSWNLPHWLAKK